MKDNILERFKFSLQALAIGGNDQLRLFPDFVNKVDELALNFVHWYDCILQNAEGELSNQQKHLLKMLNDRLEEMSNEKNLLWTEEALMYKPEWEEIRKLAVEALKSFGWNRDIPPIFSNEYIPGKRA